MKKKLVISLLVMSLCSISLLGCSKKSGDNLYATEEETEINGVSKSLDVMGVYDGSVVPKMQDYQFDLEGSTLWKGGKEQLGTFGISMSYDEVSRNKAIRSGALKAEVKDNEESSNYVTKSVIYTVAISSDASDDKGNPSAIGVHWKPVICDYYTGVESSVESKDFEKTVEVEPDMQEVVNTEEVNSEEEVVEQSTEVAPTTTTVTESKQVGSYSVSVDDIVYDITVVYEQPEWAWSEKDMLGKEGYYTYTQEVLITYPRGYDGACFGIEGLDGLAVMDIGVKDSLKNDMEFDRIALSEGDVPYLIENCHFLRLPLEDVVKEK